MCVEHHLALMAVGTVVPILFPRSIALGASAPPRTDCVNLSYPSWQPPTEMSVPFADSCGSRVCSSNTRNKLRTLTNLWESGVDASFAVETPGEAQDVVASPVATTTGIVDSIRFEVPHNVVGVVDFVSSVRLHSYAQVALPANQYPSTYLGAPVRLTVYKVLVTDGGDTFVDPAFNFGEPISQLVTRVWYVPSLSSDQQTVNCAAVSEPLNPGTYVATLTVENDASAQPYWVSATLVTGGGESGWTRAAWTNPFPTLPVAPPLMFYIRATMTYSHSTKPGGYVRYNATTQRYTCTGGPSCRQAPTGTCLPTCLSTC